MKLSLDWLRKYIPINTNLNDIIDGLTMIGFEVESVSDRFEYLDNIIVGKIEKLIKHPNSKKFSICTINFGKKRISIISSYKNITENMIVPIAPYGAILPNNNIIYKKKIKGYFSYGKLCNEKELGLGINDKKIIYIKNVKKIGRSLKNVLNLSDFVLDIAITPNRPDCSNIIGLAREIAILQNLDFNIPYIKKDNDKHINNILKVNILSSKKCPVYMIKIIDNIEVKDSPFWLQDRLISAGLNPINNIVDITNLVMIETGQPLHAFDFYSINGNELTIKNSKKKEKFKILDGTTITLPEDTLIISDNNSPMAIAGIIGGNNSKIHSNTTKIIIESAYFDPINIRKTSKLLGITTESSYRFERGVDPNGIYNAMNYAITLIQSLTTGKISSQYIKNNLKLNNIQTIINLNINAVNNVLGTKLTKDEIVTILSKLKFETIIKTQKNIKVKIPSFRIDIIRPEDLIEEIARIYGYNNIPACLPKFIISTHISDTKINLINKTKSVLNGMGFSEIINYSFNNETICKNLKLLDNNTQNKQVHIINPISSMHSVMRFSLLPAILNTIQKNISKQSKNLRLFEIGKVFISRKKNKIPLENNRLMAIWTGSRFKPHWSDDYQNCDFFDIKGVFEELLHFFDIKHIQFNITQKDDFMYMRYGHNAQVFFNNNKLGLIGEINPSFLLDYYSIKQKIFMFEIDLSILQKCLPNKKIARPIPKFPSISRDATVILNQKIEYTYLLNKIRKLDESLIENIHLLYIYYGPPIKKGMKSISIRIRYRSQITTLNDKKINYVHKSIIKKLIKNEEISLPTS